MNLVNFSGSLLNCKENIGNMYSPHSSKRKKILTTSTWSVVGSKDGNLLVVQYALFSERKLVIGGTAMVEHAK